MEVAKLNVILAQRTEVRRPGITAADVRTFRAQVSAGLITAAEFARTCYLAGHPGDAIVVEVSAIELLASNGMIRPTDNADELAAFEAACKPETITKLKLLIERQQALNEARATGDPTLDVDGRLPRGAAAKRAARLDPVAQPQ